MGLRDPVQVVVRAGSQISDISQAIAISLRVRAGITALLIRLLTYPEAHHAETHDCGLLPQIIG